MARPGGRGEGGMRACHRRSGGRGAQDPGAGSAAACGEGPARSRGVHAGDAPRGRAHRREDLGDVQSAVLAEGTAFDVEPGQSAQEGGDGFDGSGRRRSRLGEQGAALRELGPARAVGEEAEVPNTDKAAGDDMEEEAPDEFLGVEGHDLHAVTVRVVLPAEAHDAVGGADEPLVGDRHAVRIAAEVLEDLRRPGEGSLGVHDPGVVAKVPEPGGEGVRIREGRDRAGEDKLAGGEGAVKGRQVLAAEDRREGADREEEAGGRGDPASPVPTERAPGDDTVQMQVLGEILAPGMEDGRAADVTAEVARIAAKGGQRGGDGAEQERVDHAGIALGERVQGMRQREDDVEVFDGEQFGLAGGEPALFGQGLALGAVAVAAGIVGEALGPTGIARLAMATERGGTARLDGLHRAALRAGQRVGVAIRRAMGAEDVGDLHRGTLSRARRPVGRPRRTHRLGQAAGLGRSRGERVPTRCP